MAKTFICEYSLSDKEKDNFFRKKTLTQNEKEKTKELIGALRSFVFKTSGIRGLSRFRYSPEREIKYFENLGYISVVNPDRDMVVVSGYGETLDEALLPILFDYERKRSNNIEWANRQELNKQYADRFLDGEYSEKDYHGAFFVAELSLKDFRKYYGDKMPKEVINHYKEYLKEAGLGDFRYDMDANCLVKGEVKEY